LVLGITNLNDISTCDHLGQKKVTMNKFTAEMTKWINKEQNIP